MRFINFYFVGLLCLMFGACSLFHKSTRAVATDVVAPVDAVVPVVKPSNGVYTPGKEELAAVEGRFKGITLQTLTEGYMLYTGVCTGCHEAKNIYHISDESLLPLIEDMGWRAKISVEQKEAVYEYIAAIKATQVKGGK